MRAVLHIGAEKTGTTTLQNTLADNRSRLEQAGVLYSIAAGKRQHSALAMFAMDDQRTNGLTDRMPPLYRADRDRWREQVTERLDDELRGSSAHTLLVSTELFSSQLKSVAEVERVRDLLEGWADEFRVVHYLRRQDRAQVSRHSTYLRAGGTEPLNLRPDPATQRPFDYDRTLDLWARVFGDEQVTPRVYERAGDGGGDLVSDFVEAARLPVDAGTLVRPPRRNEALSVTAQDVLATFNEQARSVLSGPRLVEFRQGLVKVVEDMFPGQPARPARAAARAFYESFAESNARTAQRWFGGHPLFDDVFDDYPEEAEARGRVEVAELAEAGVRVASLLVERHQRDARRAGARQPPKTRS